MSERAAAEQERFRLRRLAEIHSSSSPETEDGHAETQWWAGGPNWLVAVLLTEVLTAALVAGLFWVVTENREDRRFEQAQLREETRLERAERLENLRYVRTAVAEADEDRWRRFPGLDLREMNLATLDLSGADLTRAQLAGADLSGVDLSGANLTGARLDGADLTKADLTGANLAGASFRGATLILSKLTGAEVRSTELSGANFTGASVSDQLLNGSRWDADDPPVWSDGLRREGS